MGETTGGATIARMLEREDVAAFFGIVDGTYTQLFAQLVERGLTMFSPRHESIAVHMAGAYARMTGRLGVCIASNGPGVANALPGVAVEHTEGNRVLLLTSSRRTGITYPDRGGAYQCFDQVAVIRPMAKWSESAQSFARIPELLRGRCARAGRATRRCTSASPGGSEQQARLVPPPPVGRQAAAPAAAAFELPTSRARGSHATPAAACCTRARSRSWRASQSCCTRR
jgi:acetolactate synthase-1/2/3 large subunit